MSDLTPQEHASPQLPAHGPWGPLADLDPVQEYQVLAQELQESFPDAQPQHLDCLIAREMAFYGGYNAAVITQAMLAASPYLASTNVDNHQAYVEHTVDEALQQQPSAQTALGWGE